MTKHTRRIFSLLSQRKSVYQAPSTLGTSLGPTRLDMAGRQHLPLFSVYDVLPEQFWVKVFFEVEPAPSEVMVSILGVSAPFYHENSGFTHLSVLRLKNAGEHTFFRRGQQEWLRVSHPFSIEDEVIWSQDFERLTESQEMQPEDASVPWGGLYTPEDPLSTRQGYAKVYLKKGVKEPRSSQEPRGIFSGQGAFDAQDVLPPKIITELTHSIKTLTLKEILSQGGVRLNVLFQDKIYPYRAFDIEMLGQNHGRIKFLP